MGKGNSSSSKGGKGKDAGGARSSSAVKPTPAPDKSDSGVLLNNQIPEDTDTTTLEAFLTELKSGIDTLLSSVSALKGCIPKDLTTLLAQHQACQRILDTHRESQLILAEKDQKIAACKVSYDDLFNSVQANAIRHEEEIRNLENLLRSAHLAREEMGERSKKERHLSEKNLRDEMGRKVSEAEKPLLKQIEKLNVDMKTKVKELQNVQQLLEKESEDGRLVKSINRTLKLQQGTLERDLEILRKEKDKAVGSIEELVCRVDEETL